MKRVLIGFGLLTALAVVGAADAQNEKAPSIKDIMTKLNKGPKSLCPVLGTALKADPPKWDDIQKETKEFATLAEALVKNDPPKGEKASWEKLCKEYAITAKDMDEAAQKKDQKAAAAAQGKLAKSCMSCHDAHRVKK